MDFADPLAPPCSSTLATRVAARAGVGATGVIVQGRDLTFKRVFIDAPVLILVDSGMKAVRWNGGECVVRAGDLLAVAGGQSVDMTNELAGGAFYRSRWLACDEALVAAHADGHPQHPVIRSALALAGARADAFRDAFARAAQALADETLPEAIVSHRVAEVLLWVSAAGGRFERAHALAMATRVRRLIAQDLARDWSAAEVAEAFAVSTPTLRRRLADEDTSLTTILVDARMSLGLQLLQSTTEPVTQIALTVGYQTPSQFAVRFRERFGFAPTAVRGHQRRARPTSMHQSLSEARP
jgi:AraC-like DNA-binding protein